MHFQDKKPRVIDVPVVMDPAVEQAYKQVTADAFEDYERRLQTFPQRVKNARATFTDPEESEAAVRRIIAEDTAENEKWAEKTRAAKETLDAVIQTVKFRSIGAKAFDALIDACPPTEDQTAEWDDAALPAVDERKFAIGLIAKAAIGTGWTEETVEAMFDDPTWSKAEIVLLYVGARHAQLQV